MDEPIYFSSIHYHSLFSWVYHICWCHTALHCWWLQSQDTAQRSLPRTFPSHFRAAWTDDGSGVDWWKQFGHIEDRPPMQLLHGPLFYPRWHQSRVSHQVNLQQSREQESVLLIRPYRWFYPFVWGERGELDSKPCMFIIAHGVGNRK